MPERVLTADAPAPIGPYSQAIARAASSSAADRSDRSENRQTRSTATSRAQTRRVLDNIAAVLAAAGCSFDDS